MSAYSDAVIADSPNMYCRLEDSAGITAVLTVGSPDMEYINTPTLGVTGALVADPNTAVTFTAASNEVVRTAAASPHRAFQDVGDVFTIEAWVKRGDSGRSQTIVVNGNSNFEFQIDVFNHTQLDKQGTASIVESTTSITDTNWHHVVATKDGATVKLYIDGVDRTGTVSNQTCVNPTIGLTIAGGGTGSFQGTIDEVALYPTALSAARVLAHYTAGTVDTSVTNLAPVIYGRGAA